MNQNKKTNCKLRLTPEEHKVLGPIMKQLVEDASLQSGSFHSLNAS